MASRRRTCKAAVRTRARGDFGKHAGACAAGGAIYVTVTVVVVVRDPSEWIPGAVGFFRAFFREESVAPGTCGVVPLLDKVLLDEFV